MSGAAQLTDLLGGKAVVLGGIVQEDDGVRPGSASAQTALGRSPAGQVTDEGDAVQTQTDLFPVGRDDADRLIGRVRVTLQQAQLPVRIGHGSDNQQGRAPRPGLRPPIRQKMRCQAGVMRQPPGHAETDQKGQAHQPGQGQNRTRQLYAAIQEENQGKKQDNGDRHIAGKPHDLPHRRIAPGRPLHLEDHFDARTDQGIQRGPSQYAQGIGVQQPPDKGRSPAQGISKQKAQEQQTDVEHEFRNPGRRQAGSCGSSNNCHSFPL